MLPLAWCLNDRSTYWSFLEERSHFDALGVSIDKSLAQQLAPLSILLNEGLLQKSNDNAILTEGLDNISRSVESLALSVERLSYVIEDGLSRISEGLAEVSSRIDRLIEISETPEQAWALEQFRISAKALKSSDIETAYDFCSRAIFGNANHTGYPLNPDFYMLLGTIHLGVHPRTPRDLLDFDKAHKAFRKALDLHDIKDRKARYEDRKARYEISKLAALALLGLNRVDEAVLLMTDEKLLTKDADGSYLFSKIEFLRGSKGWRKLMKQSAKMNPNYLLLMASDSDFKSHTETLNEFLREFRNDLTGPYRRLTKTIFDDIEKNSDQMPRLERIPTYYYRLENILDRLNALAIASEGPFSFLQMYKKPKYRLESISADYNKFLAELDIAQERCRTLVAEQDAKSRHADEPREGMSIISRLFSQSSNRSDSGAPPKALDDEVRELAKLSWRRTLSQ